jgi:hypothetical protein
LDHHQKFGGEEYWKFENANGECHWQWSILIRKIVLTYAFE